MNTAELTKKLTRIEKELGVLRRHLTTVKRPSLKRKKILQKTGGALKHKIKGDVVTWQRRVRAEWR